MRVDHQPRSRAISSSSPAISRAASAPSHPLLPWTPPARASAWVRILGGEHLEQARNPRAERYLGDTPGGLVRHELEVRRVAPDHGAEAEHGRVASGAGHPVGDHGDLERSRHPRDVDVGDAVALQGRPRPLDEPLGDRAVEPRRDDRHRPPGARERAAELPHGDPEGTSSRWPSFSAFVRR